MWMTLTLKKDNTIIHELGSLFYALPEIESCVCPFITIVLRNHACLIKLAFHDIYVLDMHQVP